ncbi:hypothetical protein FRC19_011609 [Serendipita sp. 401]|nr:hypothetical protein FRC19_011609 [Serendipita sp. 401]
MIESALNAKQWSKRPQLRCLGLGSPSESRSARLQLAFILEIMMRINIPVEDAVFYDPVFTAEDMNGMQALGLSVINGDEAKVALHPLPGPTILFMPHCDIELHQKVLESNWSFSGLRKLLMIGNPLEQYPLTTEKEQLETVFSAVGAIVFSTLQTLGQ